MLIIFVMVQVRPCSHHKKLHGSVDLFNLFQGMLLKRWNLLSRVVKAIDKYDITNVKFKPSKIKFIKLRVNGKF